MIGSSWNGKARTSIGATLTNKCVLLAVLPIELGIQAGYQAREGGGLCEFHLQVGTVTEKGRGIGEETDAVIKLEQMEIAPLSGQNFAKNARATLICSIFPAGIRT